MAELNGGRMLPAAASGTCGSQSAARPKGTIHGVRSITGHPRSDPSRDSVAYRPSQGVLAQQTTELPRTGWREKSPGPHRSFPDATFGSRGPSPGILRVARDTTGGSRLPSILFKDGRVGPLSDNAVSRPH